MRLRWCLVQFSSALNKRVKGKMRMESSLSILGPKVRWCKDEQQENKLRRMVKHRFYAGCLQETWIAAESVSENAKLRFVQHGISTQVAKARDASGGMCLVASPSY